MNKSLEDGYGDGTSYQAETGSPWMSLKMIHVVNYDKDTKE
jgi:hypothetical protein